MFKEVSLSPCVPVHALEFLFSETFLIFSTTISYLSVGTVSLSIEIFMFLKPLQISPKFFFRTKFYELSTKFGKRRRNSGEILKKFRRNFKSTGNTSYITYSKISIEVYKNVSEILRKFYEMWDKILKTKTNL